MTESILNGETIVVVRIRKEEYDIIQALRRNEDTLSDFIKRQEQYIERLEDSLHECIFTLEDIEFNAKKEKERTKKVADDKPYTFEQIKKATDGNQ